jgi:hypothetical protein
MNPTKTCKNGSEHSGAPDYSLRKEIETEITQA